MFNSRKLMLALGLTASLMTSCVLSPVPQATPTVYVTPLDTATPTLAPTFTPSMTSSAVAQLVSPTPSATAGPPTDTPTNTATPNPYATWIVQPGDTMNYIIQQPPFYYHTDSVVSEILRLNPFISNPGNLPAGVSILIPLPSATATPQNFQLTASAQSNVPQVSLPSNAQIIQVTVKDGDTIIGIAQQNATTLSIIATLNPQLTFSDCDFNNASGGSKCVVSIRVGAAVNVPALTPTPTLSPTISGSETPTPTPTYSAPILVFPPQDGSVSPRTFQLEWVSAGILRDKEVYEVEIQDQTSGAPVFKDATTSTSYDLPDSLVPTDGKTHTIQWRVSVAAPNEQGIIRYIGATGDWRTFHWQSR